MSPLDFFVLPTFNRAVMPESSDASDQGLGLETVGSLVGLVSEIAAKGEKRGKFAGNPSPEDG